MTAGRGRFASSPSRRPAWGGRMGTFTNDSGTNDSGLEALEAALAAAYHPRAVLSSCNSARTIEAVNPGTALGCNGICWQGISLSAHPIGPGGGWDAQIQDFALVFYGGDHAIMDMGKNVQNRLTPWSKK